jgi:hypothetical protein
MKGPQGRTRSGRTGTASAALCVAIVATAAAVPACATQSIDFHRVETGEVLTQGVVIRAADGSFQYTTGQPFATAWTAQNCPIEPTTSNWNLAPGAKPVVVQTPYSKTPLYGLFAFCPAPEASGQPSGRSHGIQIPRQYVAETSGGRVTFVTDGVDHDWSYRSDSGEVASAKSWPTWILWLSERPLR